MPAPDQFRMKIYEHLARLGKSLASPIRLELLDMLCQGPRTVEALAEASGQTLANTSQHLKILRAAHLVDADKNGNNVIYRIADKEVAVFISSLNRFGRSRLAEIELLMKVLNDEQGTLEAVDKGRLLDQVRKGKVMVVDVRPPEEFRAGHLPGALSIPITDLERRLSELPKNRRVVAYCRGPFCVMAIDAVRLLRSHGYNAIRLEEGVAEWLAEGLPIESVGE